MTGDHTDEHLAARSRRTAAALSLLGACLAGCLVVLFSQLPASARPWNLSVIGAVGLFAAARIGFWPGLGFTVLALALKDAAVFAVWGWGPYLLGYLFFTGYAVLGRVLLRHSWSPVRIGLTALTGSVVFFLVSNFASWLGQALPYGYTLAGLIECYLAAIPFFRGTILGDLLFSAVLFATHAVLVTRAASVRPVSVRPVPPPPPIANPSPTSTPPPNPTRPEPPARSD